MSWINEAAGGFQLKITLRDSKPLVWRRFVVPTDIPLDRLHHVIQIVMGWEDMHLHRFVIDRQPYCEQPEDPILEGKEERGVSLRGALNGETNPFMYDYDFGDDWQHVVEVEERLESLPKHQPLLVCTAGEYACPPEDSGGVHWYTEQQMKNPSQQEHEVFDLESINAELRKYLRWSRG